MSWEWCQIQRSFGKSAVASHFAAEPNAAVARLVAFEFARAGRGVVLVDAESIAVFEPAVRELGLPGASLIRLAAFVAYFVRVDDAIVPTVAADGLEHFVGEAF